MSRSRRLALKAFLVLGLSVVALLIRDENAQAAACETAWFCTDDCQSIPPSFATQCSLCDANVTCIWAGDVGGNCDPEQHAWCPYPPCAGQYVYGCEWES